MTQRRSVKRGYKNGDSGGVWSRAVWSFVGATSLFWLVTAALRWAVGAVRRWERRPRASALGTCLWICP